MSRMNLPESYGYDRCGNCRHKIENRGSGKCSNCGRRYKKRSGTDRSQDKKDSMTIGDVVEINDESKEK